MNAIYKSAIVVILGVLPNFALYSAAQADDLMALDDGLIEYRITDVSLIGGDADQTDGGCDAKGCSSCGSRLLDSLPCNRCGCDEGWRLFPEHRSGLQAHGWINGGITFNSHKNPSRFNGPVRFNDRDRDWQFNQVYAVLERATDPNACGWQIGGRADLLFGTDARFATAIGLERGQNEIPELNSGQRFYHLAFPQFYVEARYNAWQFIGGHFYANFGYESVPAPENFFYSHSYMFTWGEPFTFTGGLAKWQATDQLQLRAGVHNGWNNFSHNNHIDSDDVGAIAGFTWNNCADTIAIHGNYTWSKEPLGFEHDRNLLSLVFDWRLNHRWQYAAQFAGGWQTHSAINEPVEWQGISQYLFYTINDCWKAGLRAEWFRDDDASRVHGLDYLASDDFANPSAFQAYSGDFYEVALGLNWTPCANVVVRPEVRWDWFDNANVQNSRPFGEDATGGFSDKLNQVLFAFDAIITF